MPPYTRQTQRIELPPIDTDTFQSIEDIEGFDIFADMPQLNGTSEDRETNRNVFGRALERIADIIGSMDFSDPFETTRRAWREMPNREVGLLLAAGAPLSVRDHHHDGSVTETWVPSRTRAMMEDGIAGCYRLDRTFIHPNELAAMSRIFLCDRLYGQRMCHFADVAEAISLSINGLDLECSRFSAPGVEIPCAITEGYRGHVTKGRKIDYVRNGVPFFFYVRPEDLESMLNPFTAVMPYDESSVFYPDMVAETIGKSGRRYMIVSVTGALVARFSILVIDANHRPYDYACEKGCRCGIKILVNLAADIRDVSINDDTFTDNHHRENLVKALESVHFKNIEGFLRSYDQLVRL